MNYESVPCFVAAGAHFGLDDVTAFLVALTGLVVALTPLIRTLRKNKKEKDHDKEDQN